MRGRGESRMTHETTYVKRIAQLYQAKGLSLDYGFLEG